MVEEVAGKVHDPDPMAGTSAHVVDAGLMHRLFKSKLGGKSLLLCMTPSTRGLTSSMAGMSAA